MLADNLRRADLGYTQQFFAQRLAEIRHLFDVIDTGMMYPLENLLRTELLLPDVQEELLHLAQGQAQEVYPGLAFAGGDEGGHGLVAAAYSGRAQSSLAAKK